MKAFKQLCWLTGIFILFFSCKKEKSLERASSVSGPSQWEFKDSAALFKGKMDTAYKVSAASMSSIVLIGTSSDASKGNFRLEIFSSNLATGTYKSPNVKFSYLVSGSVLYESVTTNADKFSVTITSLDSTSVKGEFSGEVQTPVGTGRKITQGSFSASFSSSPAQQPPPSTATGQLVLWAKNRCSGSTNLSVKIQNQTKNITSFYTSEPACGATGAATFDLPAGLYTWTASCGPTDSVSGTVSITASQCVKKEVIIPGAGSPAAKLILTSSATNCSNTKVNGTYTVGTALGATNTVEVEVNVTAAGSYNISTSVKNGIWFEGTGSISSTGLQKVTLKGQGTPTTAGANSVGISVGTSTCSFNVDVVPGSGGGTPGANTWSFTQGSKTYSGTFALNADLADHPLGTGKVLWFDGEAGQDTLFDLVIHFPTAVAKPVPGTYKTQPSYTDLSNVNTFNLYLQTPTARTDIFTSKTLTGVGSNVISIVITSYDDATKVVQGTFSGKAWDKAGGSVDITNGKFKCGVDL